MQPFVYRLVERLTEEGPPLSRNRHFHTFDSPEGRQASRIARRLRSLAEDISAAQAPYSLEEEPERRRPIRLEIPLASGARTAWLTESEWRLLMRLLPSEVDEELPERGEGIAGEGVDQGPRPS